MARSLVILAILLGTVHRVPGSGDPKFSRVSPGLSRRSRIRRGIGVSALSETEIHADGYFPSTYDLRTKTEGYVTLLFFGYTYCPDMCPLQMSMIAQTLKKIPPASADQFKVVFVTTDPERDSPQVLRSWLDHFDKRFIGLTGS